MPEIAGEPKNAANGWRSGGSNVGTASSTLVGKATAAGDGGGSGARGRSYSVGSGEAFVGLEVGRGDASDGGGEGVVSRSSRGRQRIAKSFGDEFDEVCWR